MERGPSPQLRAPQPRSPHTPAGKLFPSELEESRATGERTRIRLPQTLSGNSDFLLGAISRDGHSAVFGSSAICSTSDTNATKDLFLARFTTSEILLVSGAKEGWISGKRYVVEVADRLFGPWVVLGSLQGTGKPESFIALHGAPESVTAEFYRVRVR